MDPLHRARLSLVWRTIVALGAVALAAAVVTGFVAVFGGFMGWIAVRMFLGGALPTLLESFPPLVAAVEHLAARVEALPTRWAVAACGLVVVGYEVRAVRRRLRTFHEELLAETAPLEEGHPLVAETRRLAQLADVPVPTVRLVPTDDVVSYVVGPPAAPTVVVSRGIRERLSEPELEAILAHEVGHLANRDLRIVAAALVPLLVAEAWRLEDGGPLAVVSGLVSWFARLAVAVLTRGRELAADAAAARLTGSPSTLASALVALEERDAVPTVDKRTWHRSTSSLNVVPAVGERDASGLLATHPPLSERLARLEALAAAGSER